MCKPHIWLVLCLLLYNQEGSLNLIKDRHYIAYYWISYGVRSTKELQALGWFKLLDNCLQLPAWEHPKYHAECSKKNIMEESVEGHDTWNDSHVETRNFKPR